MRLAPIIERYMNLKRQENAVLSNSNLMQQSIPIPTDRYSYVSEVLSIHIRLLCEPCLSALSQVCIVKITQYKAELAAMDEVVLEKWKKIQEMYNKSSYIQQGHKPH